MSNSLEKACWTVFVGLFLAAATGGYYAPDATFNPPSANDPTSNEVAAAASLNLTDLINDGGIDNFASSPGNETDTTTADNTNDQHADANSAGQIINVQNDSAVANSNF